MKNSSNQKAANKAVKKQNPEAENTSKKLNKPRRSAAYQPVPIAKVLIVDPMVVKAEFLKYWLEQKGMECEIARPPLQTDARQKAEWFACDIVIVGLFNYIFDPQMLIRDIMQCRPEVRFMAIVSQYSRVDKRIESLPAFKGVVHEVLGLPVVEKVLANAIEGKTCKEVVDEIAVPDEEDLRLWNLLSDYKKTICKFVGQGWDRKEVSEIMHKEDCTIRNRLTEIYTVLPAKNMDELKEFVKKIGII